MLVWNTAHLPRAIATYFSTGCVAPFQLTGCFEIIVATNHSVIKRAQFSCPNRRGVSQITLVTRRANCPSSVDGKVACLNEFLHGGICKHQ
jgi:hypothetical protein